MNLFILCCFSILCSTVIATPAPQEVKGGLGKNIIENETQMKEDAELITSDEIDTAKSLEESGSIEDEDIKLKPLENNLGVDANSKNEVSSGTNISKASKIEGEIVNPSVEEEVNPKIIESVDKISTKINRSEELEIAGENVDENKITQLSVKNNTEKTFQPVNKLADEKENQSDRQQYENKSQENRNTNETQSEKNRIKEHNDPKDEKFTNNKRNQQNPEDETEFNEKKYVSNQAKDKGQKVQGLQIQKSNKNNVTKTNQTPLSSNSIETQSLETKLKQEKTQTKKETTFSGDKRPNNPVLRPNIVFIVADDLGWDDVSFHGSDQIMTPNIDTLAYTGVVLHQYYTDVQGTASRSALFTGKHPVRLGTQGASIKASEDRGIPASERLLPAYLKDLGYATHLVGKWDVGKSRELYLPTSRGFDKFYGFLGSSVDYYTYNLIEEVNQTYFFGLDFFDGTKPVEDQHGYLTEVLTDKAIQIIRDHDPDVPLYLHLCPASPHASGGLAGLQAPVADIQANDHIAHSARRLYAGLVTSLDRSIGNIIAALAEMEMLENTVIVFVSDNGAATTGANPNFGSNLPLRGMKHTPWEGGARSTAIAWHKSLKPATLNDLFHVTDWLPTLVTAAGGNMTSEIDGIDQWGALVDTEKQPRRMDVLITIDEKWAALREGDFKIIVGDVNRKTSGYRGIELQVLRHKPLPYESILLESEACRVFKETLQLAIDVDEALNKRRECNLLTQLSQENRVREPCIPTNEKGCLFNITADPLEAKDLWNSSANIVQRLTLRLRTIWTELKPRLSKRDPRANPALHNHIWAPWVKNEEVKLEPNMTAPPFPLQVSMGEMQYLVDLNLNMFRDRMYDYIKSMGDSFMKSVGGLFSI